MITRRGLLAALAGLPLVGRWLKRPKPASLNFLVSARIVSVNVPDKSAVVEMIYTPDGGEPIIGPRITVKGDAPHMTGPGSYEYDYYRLHPPC